MATLVSKPNVEGRRSSLRERLDALKAEGLSSAVSSVRSETQGTRKPLSKERQSNLVGNIKQGQVFAPSSQPEYGQPVNGAARRMRSSANGPRHPGSNASATSSKPRTSSTLQQRSSKDVARNRAGMGMHRQNQALLDEQLSTLDVLKDHLEDTAKQVPEDESGKESTEQKSRRSAAEQWKKFQDLATQLEKAKADLEELDADLADTSHVNL
jgi:hypothetical protein